MRLLPEERCVPVDGAMALQKMSGMSWRNIDGRARQKFDGIRDRKAVIEGDGKERDFLRSVRPLEEQAH